MIVGVRLRGIVRGMVRVVSLVAARTALRLIAAIWLTMALACGAEPPNAEIAANNDNDNGNALAVRPEPRPNIIVIMTDDQRWDEIQYMPALTKRLVDRGVSFSNSFVTTSLCCPSRASFLSGQYAHHHGIVTLGGAPRFRADSTIAVWLDQVGYRTALIGKYLNENARLAPRIPPGWDVWRTFADTLMSFSGKFLYYDYELNEDGKLVSYGDEPEDYSTDVLAAMADTFIRDNRDAPFFLVFTPFAPHAPPIPAPRHAGLLATTELPRRGNHFEHDVSDKPAHIRNHPGQATWSEERATLLNEETRKRRIPILESLLAVDEAIDGMLDTLVELEIDDNTIVIFTSDNGFMWGEHWKIGKLYAYEESIRVPLVILDPRRRGGPKQIDELALNIDLAPTIAEFAQAEIGSAVDGRSLVPLLAGESVDWRKDFLIELPPDKKRYAFAAVRSKRWKYVVNHHDGAFEELYDLSADPLELDNLLVTRKGDAGVADVTMLLRKRIEHFIGADPMRPPPSQ